MAAIPFARHEPAKLDRYLDITKSAMLFGTRVILVEGLAEALLMPAFADIVLNAVPDEDARRRAKAVFRGTCIVAVDGVDFKPYMRALMADVNGVRIADRLLLITDQDPQKKKTQADVQDEPAATATQPALDDAEDEPQPEVGFNRAVYLEKHLLEWNVPPSAFHIAESRPTLEPELMRAENRALLAEVFYDLRPKSGHHWEPVDKAATPAEQAAAFGSLFTSPTIKLSKGDFAYRLAERLGTDPSGFVVPEHLAAAIRWIAGVDDATT